MTLPAGEALLVDRDPELLRHRVDVLDVQVDERVRARVALVLGEVEPNLTAGDGEEPREARLELVLPFLVEAEPLVPGDGAAGVLDLEHRDDLLVH